MLRIRVRRTLDVRERDLAFGPFALVHLAARDREGCKCRDQDQSLHECFRGWSRRGGAILVRRDDRMEILRASRARDQWGAYLDRVVD